jgi:hypothetical protein
MLAFVDQVRLEASLKFKKKLKKRLKFIELFLQHLSGHTVEEDLLSKGTAFM